MLRYIVAAAMLVALAPVANAQTTQGNMGSMGGTNAMPNYAAAPSASASASQPGGENCGTPDSPKACPPLPRHPLAYYPANKQ
jgi:hypothetical protein